MGGDSGGGLRSVLILGLALAGWSATAAAQVDFGGSYGVSLGSDLMNQAMISSAYAPRRGAGAVGAQADRAARERQKAGSAGGSAANVRTTYRADPAVTERVRRQFLGFVASRSGARGEEGVRAAFARTDPLQLWARQAAPDGMRPGDVADAMTEYWVTNWLMANHQADAPPRRVQAVRTQVRHVLAANPAFRRLDDAGRQEMAEALVYNTILQAAVYGDAAARHDEATMRRAGEAAVARFRNEARLDLRAVDLTDAGFVRKG